MKNGRNKYSKQYIHVYYHDIKDACTIIIIAQSRRVSIRHPFRSDTFCAKLVRATSMGYQNVGQ